LADGGLAALLAYVIANRNFATTNAVVFAAFFGFIVTFGEYFLG
jgi:hypothetical protein